MARAAFFDLDKTLIGVNSAALYSRWQLKRGEARRRDYVQATWWLGQYALGLLDAEAVAAQVALQLAGRDEAVFGAETRAWAEREVLPHVNREARREVERRRAAGFVCAILTSATRYAAEPVAAALGIEHVLASTFVIDGGRFTGRIASPLCYGTGKVHHAEAFALAHDIDLATSVFYTDSISDRPMLERVGEAVVVDPDPRLAWLARRRSWPVRYWRGAP